MLQLAWRYASLKGTTILAHRIIDNSIIFILGSGGKFTMSTRELEEAIAKLESAEPLPAPALLAQEKEIQAAEPPAKKGKSKRG
jgi:hypothetical protein